MTSPIDDHIAQHSGRQRELMVELRDLIRALVPDAEETISYGMPTFRLNGNLVHFAAFAHHVGFYPGADGVVLAEPFLTGLTHSKGAIRFPLDQPLPVELVRHVVTLRAEQQRAKKRRPPKPSA